MGRPKPADLDMPTGNLALYVYQSGSLVGVVEVSDAEGAVYNGRDWAAVKEVLTALSKYDVAPSA